jgi:hypothetical protein
MRSPFASRIGGSISSLSWHTAASASVTSVTLALFWLERVDQLGIFFVWRLAQTPADAGSEVARRGPRWIGGRYCLRGLVGR